jgi:hypothetical protein
MAEEFMNPVFSNDPHQHSVARHTVPNRQEVFVVLVPDKKNGQSITLSSSPRSLSLANQPATVIARFALKNKPHRNHPHEHRRWRRRRHGQNRR